MRFHSTSATLIDNVLINNVFDLQLSGNIISDISDHFSQFCIMVTNPSKRSLFVKNKFRDYTCFSEAKFLADLSNIKWMDTTFKCKLHLLIILYNQTSPSERLGHVI